jgi:predicted DNA-binding transcriptional regulator AlpA
MRLLRRPEVEAKTGKSRTSIYNGVRAGTFPKPVEIGPNSVGWLESEVDAWIEERIARRGRRKPLPKGCERCVEGGQVVTCLSHVSETPGLASLALLKSSSMQMNVLQ